MKLLLLLFVIAFGLDASEQDALCIIYLKGTCSSGKSTLMRSLVQQADSLEVVDEDAIMHGSYVEAVSSRYPEVFNAIQHVIAKENLYHALREKDVLFKSDAGRDACCEAENALSMIQEELNQDLHWRQEVSLGIDAEVLRRIEEALSANKNVLLDSWYIKPERLKHQFPEVKIIKVLLYCPLPIAYERLLKRNKEAHAKGDLSEKRYLRQLIGGFLSLYQINSELSQPIQKITRADLDPVLNEMAKGLDGAQFYQKSVFTFEEISKGYFLEMKEGFLRPFTDSLEELYLGPRETYDVIIDASTGASVCHMYRVED